MTSSILSDTIQIMDKKTSEALKERVQQKLKQPQNRMIRAYPEPRYDDVYFRGVAWLNGVDMEEKRFFPLQGSPSMVISHCWWAIWSFLISENLEFFQIGRDISIESLTPETFIFYQTDNQTHAIEIESELVRCFHHHPKCLNSSFLIRRYPLFVQQYVFVSLVLKQRKEND